MKLSIIIPVYGTQDTLKRCIESVLQQSFTDYEMILIDDGSPDECPHMCDEYAQREERISVIHKSHHGLSDARNAGIERAKGEYITFIDSDDGIAEGTLQLLMDELTRYPQIDVLEYPIKERIGHPSQEKLLSFHPQNYKTSWEYWLNEQVYEHTYVCNKIFKKHLFKNIAFPQGKSFEDVQTLPYLISLIPHEEEVNMPQIRVTDVGCYLYTWNGKGITANARYEDLLSLYTGQILALIYLFKNIENQETLLEKYQQSLNLLMTHILNVLLDLYELSEKYENCSSLIKYIKLMKTKGLISSWKLKLLIIIGYKRLCKINRLIHKIYRHR